LSRGMDIGNRTFLDRKKKAMRFRVIEKDISCEARLMLVHYRCGNVKEFGRENKTPLEGGEEEDERLITTKDRRRKL